MEDIFGKIPAVKLSEITCHTGGAIGSDTLFETYTTKVKGTVRAYSYKTEYHKSPNKVEISEEEYKEGVHQVNRANHWLNRWGIQKYMNLLARNWPQVKYSHQIIAIGEIVKKGKRNKSGYYNRGKYTAVDGGTGYAVMMGILHKRLIFVFDQIQEKWFKWSYDIDDFIEIDENDVYLTDKNFAGIGTRKLNESGKKAIKWVFLNTHKNYE